MNNASHQARGKASQVLLDLYATASQEACLNGLFSEDGAQRSAAATYLELRKDHVETLCVQLQKESCLYTRIAICHRLAQGDVHTARILCRYLGTVGHNQHKTLPKAVSKKKSYPLPRDLIARTLGKMHPDILPALLEVLKSGEKETIKEALDAFGFLLYYHQELPTIQYLPVITALCQRWQTDAVLLWKCMMVLSAIPAKDTIIFLKKYENETSLIGTEARKSLAHIHDLMERKKC